MDLTGFFGSYPGRYIVQSFFHLSISAAIVNAAIRVWDIENPVVSQRFRFLAILFPVFSFPLYELVNPDRGTLHFREHALFDSGRWLSLEPFGKFPLGLLFISVLVLTTLVFIFQELIPVVRHTIEAKGGKSRDMDLTHNPELAEILSHLPYRSAEVMLIDEEDPVIFSTTGGSAAVYLSSGLLKSLDHEQIRAAVAHEIAHIERSKRPLLFIVFLFRVVMFFNPVVLLEFRKAAQEEEKICDDMAVALTKKPQALSQALKKLYYKGEKKGLQIGPPSELKESLEEYSHVLHIESRIERLESFCEECPAGEWVKFSLACLAIVGINYFII